MSKAKEPEITNEIIKPQMMTVITRKLKSGVTFEEYHNKWEPNVEDKATYFSFPVQIIHLVNVSDPSEIISIGLLDTTEEELFAEAKRISANEKKRGQKIAPLCDAVSDTKLYRVVKIDTLGT